MASTSVTLPSSICDTRACDTPITVAAATDIPAEHYGSAVRSRGPDSARYTTCPGGAVAHCQCGTSRRPGADPQANVIPRPYDEPHGSGHGIRRDRLAAR